ncbi:MAG: hypothetical protein CMD35_05710 [Flavobacteriales bacterium]|nr:hypothetical protein [Flavobacteriales bacterium]
MKSLCCFFFAFVSLFELKSQINHDGLKLHRTLSNFGEVELWVSRIDSFLVTNTSKKTIFILKQLIPRGFELKTPNSGILPGESSVIEVIYNPSAKGKFKEKLKLYHSESNQPFFYEFRGEVKSFDPYSDIACPSFSNSNFRKLSFDVEIKVIDSISKKPLNKALIELGKGENYQQFYTNKEGLSNRKLDLGLFFVHIEFEGYESKSIQHYFNPKRRTVTITLVPKTKKDEPFSEIHINVISPSLLDTNSEELAKPEYSYIPLKETSENVENENFPIAKFEENNIVFLIDVSASMRGEDRLELLKKSMIQLTYMLRSVDKVTIITYSDDCQVVLSSTSAKNKNEIIKVIQGLEAGGTTFGGKAIRQAYKTLKKGYIQHGNNQIILATDGGFNGLGKSEERLYSFVKSKASKGMYLSALGYGKNKRGKQLIENLSNSGKGKYIYIESEKQANVEVNQMIMEQSLRD